MTRIPVIAAGAILCALTSPSEAGCASWGPGGLLTDPAPRARVCYAGKCRMTTLRSSCGNMTSTSARWSNGLEIISYGDVDTALPWSRNRAFIYRNSSKGRHLIENGPNRKIAKKLTCTPKNDGGCEGWTGKRD